MTTADLQAAMTRIGELIQELEATADEATRERARELVQTILDVHREGLARLVELAAARGPLDELVADEAVALLFSLHELHRDSPETRVRAALGELAPRLEEQGVAVDLDAVGEESVAVTLRAVGPVRAHVAGLRATLEGAIRRAAPEIAEVTIGGLEASDVPVDRLSVGPPRR